MTSSPPVTVCTHADAEAFVCSRLSHKVNLCQVYDRSLTVQTAGLPENKVLFNKTISRVGSRIARADMLEQETAQCTAEDASEAITPLSPSSERTEPRRDVSLHEHAKYALFIL